MVEDQISENFEQTQCLNLRSKKTQLEEYCMVVIRDAQNHNNDCSVFPPINHENLQIPSHSFQHCEFPDSPSSSSSSSSLYSSSPPPSSYSDTSVLSPTPSPPSDSRLRKSGDFAGWMSIGFQILRSKGFAVVTSFRNYVANRGAIWSIGSSAAASFVISWWMCLQFCRWMRRRRQMHVENHLTAIIKRKDERIAKLLQQIAQMNEILATHHKA